MNYRHQALDAIQDYIMRNRDRFDDVTITESEPYEINPFFTCVAFTATDRNGKELCLGYEYKKAPD
jgi:hypothetical protein